MQNSVRFPIQAVLCCLILIACILACHPYAETGMTDDWSYFRTAQILASTGHFAFNGWGAPTLIWQMLVAAPMIKIFGASFFTVRMTTVIFAGVPATFFTHRAMVRCGITESNASLATLTVLLSPISLPSITSFLTDCWGVCAIAICLYACLKALQAPIENNRIGWIAAASLGNAVLGSSRQLSWFGVLIMVPCTLWLLRRQRRVLWFGGTVCALGWAIVAGCLHWLSRQPYTVPESMGIHGIRHHFAGSHVFTRPALEIPMLMLPVLVAFIPAVWRSGRRAVIIFTGLCLLVIAKATQLQHLKQLSGWLVPFIVQKGGVFSKNGSYVMWPVRGPQPLAIPEPFRYFFAALTFMALFSFLVSFFRARRAHSAPDNNAIVSWHQLLVLTVPFFVLYVLLLAPRGLLDRTIDRYLIPLVLVAMILATRYYQERIATHLPWSSFTLLAVITVFTVAEVHDSFAMYRAVVAAADSVTSTGVPRDQIDAGWEYNGWTQIVEATYIHQDGIKLPTGTLQYGSVTARRCPVIVEHWLPQIKPIYTLSFTPDDCGGRTAFDPVAINRWLPPHKLQIYVVLDPPLSSPSAP